MPLAMLWAQEPSNYQKKVLQAAEVDLLMGFYDQSGEHAAVTGGEGTEALTDFSTQVVLRLPVGQNGVFSLDTGISAYSSASTSNINPLDGDPDQPVNPYQASSGASRNDVYGYVQPSYSHSSGDRNTEWNANAYYSWEFDYYSLGIGGGLTQQFNEQNTTLTVQGQLYFDKWNPQYPIELRPGFFDDRITGPGTYDPQFVPFDDERRRSYSLSLGLLQLLGKRFQAGLYLDMVYQQGLLGTPFHRIYFADQGNYYIDSFQLADDVERLPDTRFKVPLGLRLNYYLSDRVVTRAYVRGYTDSWGLQALTASVELPVKLGDRFTLSPQYRYYIQDGVDYFYGPEEALSTFTYYTSDYDLSRFQAHQYGLGLGYRDAVDPLRLPFLQIKTLDLRLGQYIRNNGLDAFYVSLGVGMVLE